MPDKKKKKVVPVAAPNRSQAIMRANKKKKSTKPVKKTKTNSLSNVHTGSAASDPGVLKAQADKKKRQARLKVLKAQADKRKSQVRSNLLAKKKKK